MLNDKMAISNVREILIIEKNGIEVGGIQVKPQTFKYMRREVIIFSRAANQKWGKSVLYLYYDGNEKFLNLTQLIIDIKKL